MKKLLFILVALLPISVFAQGKSDLPIDTVTHKISYQLVQLLPSLKQKQLYLNAKEWLIKKFVSSKDVTQLDDQQSGKIIAEGYSIFDQISGATIFKMKLWYTATFLLRDGKYKFILTDFRFQLPDDDSKINAEGKVWPEMNNIIGIANLHAIERAWKDFSTSLNDSMSKKDDF
jgi:hypothetical protein